MISNKKRKKSLQLVDSDRIYALGEAVSLIKKLNFAGFAGSVEFHIAIRLPKGKDAKSIKFSMVLPNSVQREIKVAVITSPQYAAKAKEAGADDVGLDDLIKEIKEGTKQFDVYIATPDAMPKVATLGKELGPRGLMPSPKNGTIADPSKIKNAINEFKQGKLTLRADESGGLHIPMGSLEFSNEQLIENAKAIFVYISELMGKPAENITKSVYMAPTMGPSVRVDIKSL